MPSYTLEQVKAHCTPDDIWIILHNKVYDVTNDLEDHPGGSAVLIEVAGPDATKAFEEIGHSEEAREQLEPYYIGGLPDTEQAESVEIYRTTFEQISQSAVINTEKTNKTAYQLLHALPALASPFSLPKVSGNAGTQFWSGVRIATVTQLSLSLGLGVWVSTKLDVQQEFYPPRQLASSARLIRRHVTAQAPTPRSPVLDARQWRSFPLTSKKEVTPNVYRLVFGLPEADGILGLRTGQHVALRATINGKTV
ncbi:cytochrome b5-like heme/steroid binding domain-containing protein [Aspergillus desertorum]